MTNMSPAFDILMEDLIFMCWKMFWPPDLEDIC